jgi:phage gpG-like protein
MASSVVGSQQLGAALSKALAAVGPENRKKALMRGGLVLERWMKENIKKHHLIDTRNLTNAVTAEPEGSSTVTIGPRNVVYAAIHEFGGTIKPKAGKYLAIPVTAAARQAGSPRSMGGLHFQLVAGGAALVDEGGDIQYVLKTSVTIPARPYVRPALDEHGQEAVGEVAKAIKILLPGGGS